MGLTSLRAKEEILESMLEEPVIEPPNTFRFQHPENSVFLRVLTVSTNMSVVSNLCCVIRFNLSFMNYIGQEWKVFHNGVLMLMLLLLKELMY